MNDDSKCQPEAKPGAVADRSPPLAEATLGALNAILWEGDFEACRFHAVWGAAERLLGFPTERWLSQSDFWHQLLHPDDREAALGACRSVSEDGVEREFEHRAIGAGGRVIRFRTRVHKLEPKVDGSGCLCGLMVDISERGRLMNAIDTAQVRLDMVLRNAPVVLFALDRDGVFTLSEGRGLGALGLEPGQVVGRSAFDVYKDVPWILEGVRTALEGTEVADSGQVGDTHFEARFVPVRDDSGAPAGLIGTAFDVTEQRQASAARREAEERLRTVLSYTPLILFAIDPDGIITLSEGQGLAALGLKSGQLVGESVFDVYKDVPWVLEQIEDALAGRRFTGGGDLGVGIFETKYAPLWDDNGYDAGVIGVTWDVTERTRAQEELKRSVSLLRATLDSTADGILVSDLSGRVTVFNQKVVELLETPAEVFEKGDPKEVRSYAVRSLRDPASFEARLGELYQNMDLVARDVLELTDGRVLERYSLPQHLGDQPVGRVWSFRDVTDRHQAEETKAKLLEQEQTARVAAESQQRRAAFLANASTLLAGTLDYDETLVRLAELVVPYLADWCVVDIREEDGSFRRVAVVHADPERAELAQQLCQYPPLPRRDELVARVVDTGRPLLLKEIPESLASSPLPNAALSEAQSRKEARRNLVQALGIQGAMIVPLRARGRTLGALSFISQKPHRYHADDLALASDLAHRAALSVDNARLYQDAQEAIRLREEFLSIASHELKTPVTALQLALQSVLHLAAKRSFESIRPEFLLKAFETAERQGRRLAKLVDDLLDVSRITGGRIELEVQQLDLAAVTRDVAASFADGLRRAGCQLKLQASEPVTGIWDRARLEQVLTNLLSNAIKYGAGQPVEVSVTREGHLAQIVVRDRGIGIESKEHLRIFERFERASSSNHYGGLGLGLYIVRRILDAIGGKIAVTSAPGEGATFTVTLPRNRT